MICLFSESRKPFYQFEQINKIWAREEGLRGRPSTSACSSTQEVESGNPGLLSLTDHSGSLLSTASATPGPQTARLLGKSKTSRKVSVLEPKMTVEAKANPGTPCQVLDQCVLDLSLCTVAWVNVLVKLKANHGLSPRPSDGHSLSLSEIYPK